MGSVYLIVLIIFIVVVVSFILVRNKVSVEINNSIVRIKRVIISILSLICYNFLVNKFIIMLYIIIVDVV